MEELTARPQGEEQSAFTPSSPDSVVAAGDGSSVPAEEDSLPPVPLVVGVTGHRDPAAAARGELLQKLTEFFSHIRGGKRSKEFSFLRPCPNTRLVLISPLAEGADRLAAMALAASVASKKVGRSGFGPYAELIVPMPFPEDEYQKDFTASRGADVAEEPRFDEIIRESGTVPFALAHADCALRDRAQCYARVGAYIARHSYVMIAMWDGRRNGPPGGTSQVLRFRRRGIPSDYVGDLNAIDEPHGGPVCWIPTPRDASAGSTCASLAPRLLHSPGTRDKQASTKSLLRALSDLDGFNSDCARLARSTAHRRDASARELMPHTIFSKLPVELRASLEPVRRTFAFADVLAARYKNCTYGAMRLLFIGTAFIALFYLAYTYLKVGDTPQPLFMRLHAALLLGALIFYGIVRLRRWQAKAEDYRALAEGLRVQFYWRLAFGPPSPLEGSVADRYLRRQKGELNWIRYAIQAVALWPPPGGRASLGFGCEETNESGCSRKERLKTVARCWVRGQLNYYCTGLRQDRALMNRLRRGARYAGALGILLIVCLCAWEGWLSSAGRPHALLQPEGLRAWGRNLMGDAAVITAAFLVSLKVGVIESLWTATRRLGSPSRRTLAKTRPPTLRNSAKGWFERVRLDLGLLAGSRILAGVAAGCLTGLAAWALSTTETLPSFAGLLRFLAAFSATSSALLWAYCDKQALPAHVKQYERMAAIFERADRELDRLLRSSKAPHEHDLGERILQELGQEALAENADWILLHRERPVDVPYKS